MGFTQDEYIVVDSLDGTTPGGPLESKDGVYTNLSTPGRTFYNGKVYTREELQERIKKDNIFAEQDYNIIIKVFEVETSNWQREDYAVAYHYKDIYSTKNFSARVREQMSAYPGMHQITDSPDGDPFYKEGERRSEQRLDYWDDAMDNPQSFENALRNNKQDFDYTKIFGSDQEAADRAKELGKMLSECIPCFNRTIDPNMLLPDGNLLEIHALNIKVRTDLLDQLKALFGGPGLKIDICEILKLLSGICLQDLIAMSALLTQYLAKLNLDIKFNLDFILQLVGPILSPFLDAIGDWLDMWIQLIIEPMICVIDHINETIITAQQAKIPFSQVSGSISSDVGVAGPGFLGNVSNENTSGFNFGLTEDGDDVEAGVGTSNSLDVFKTPDAQKYNPSTPVFPSEEFELAAEEVRSIKRGPLVGASTEDRDPSSAFSPGLTELERAERDKRWVELRAKQNAKRHKVPPPLRIPDPQDGTLWSKNDIPESEKYSYNMDWSKGSYLPPERQQVPKSSGEEYFVTTPLVSGMVQLRNVLQGAIEYVRDWFTYITQMIYDLLGVDIGWMQKKTGTSILKSNIIQIIQFIAAIIKAVRENGLKCGEESNYDEDQLRFMAEQFFTQQDPNFDYTVLDDGSMEITPTGQRQVATNETTEIKESTGESVSVDRQGQPESSIIVQTCFKDVSADELAKAREWIADFEERGGS